jgi:hypothetical protein
MLMPHQDIISSLQSRNKKSVHESVLPIKAQVPLQDVWERCPVGTYTRCFKFKSHDTIPFFIAQASECAVDRQLPSFSIHVDGSLVKVRIGDSRGFPTGLEIEVAQDISSIYDDVTHTYELVQQEDIHGY